MISDRRLRCAMLIGIAMVCACALASAGARAQADDSGQARTPPIVADKPSQRAILYEEDPNNPNGQRFDGTATWRAKIVPGPRPNGAPDTVIEAVVSVPERGLSLMLTLRRNTDASLPASHTIELRFKLSEAAPASIGNVPGVLMKTGETARGVPLASISVKVTNGIFLIGLSALPADRSRNRHLLAERGWIDVPIVYDNGRRAILAFEKGEPGEAAVTAAFAAWEGTATPPEETPPGRAQDPAVTRSPAPAETDPPPRDRPQ